MFTLIVLRHLDLVGIIFFITNNISVSFLLTKRFDGLFAWTLPTVRKVVYLTKVVGSVFWDNAAMLHRLRVKHYIISVNNATPAHQK